MELWANEINHVFKWVNSISWTISSMDMELVPLGTAGIEVYKNIFKHGDPHHILELWVFEVNYVLWFWTHW